MEKQRKRYRIWFEQVNQMMIEAVGETEEKAIANAKKYWKSQYGKPVLSYIEEKAEPKL